MHQSLLYIAIAMNDDVKFLDSPQFLAISKMLCKSIFQPIVFKFACHYASVTDCDVDSMSIIIHTSISVLTVAGLLIVFYLL